MSGRFFHEQLDGALPDSFTVVAPDYRGHGQSEKVHSGHTVAGYARDLRSLLIALQIERPVLVGWSMGAMVAWEYVKEFGSDSIAGLVVVDQPPSDFAWDGYPFGLMTLAGLAENVEALQGDQRAVAQEFADLMQHVPDHSRTAWIVDEILKVPASIASTAAAACAAVTSSMSLRVALRANRIAIGLKNRTGASAVALFERASATGPA